MTVRLALGAMWFGTTTDEGRAFELLDRFVDAGGGWIDTADSSAFWVDPTGVGGQSEEVVGRWLAARPGVRARVRISTKVGVAPTAAGTAEGLSTSAVTSAVDGSLRRLGADHVDLCWAHLPDPATPLEETVAAFEGLVTRAVSPAASTAPTTLSGRSNGLGGSPGRPAASASPRSGSTAPTSDPARADGPPR